MLQLAKRLKLSFVLCKLEREHLSCNQDLKEQNVRTERITFNHLYESKENGSTDYFPITFILVGQLQLLKSSPKLDSANLFKLI